ncbi:MAG: hypothetical protein N3C59_10930, partial [Azovibrio sp.]|nr:hypothetical protein [Azovibrio sp.]
HTQTSKAAAGKNCALSKSDGREAETGQKTTDIVSHDASKKPSWKKEKNGASTAADFEATGVACWKYGWNPERGGQGRTGDKPENKSAIRELVRFGGPRKAGARKGKEASAEGCAYK